jgi:hypothetical protein
MLAHVRLNYALSHETYESPRMTRELQDSGFANGRRRTARLMRENGSMPDRNGGSTAPRIASMPFWSRPISSIRVLQRLG